MPLGERWRQATVEPLHDDLVTERRRERLCDEAARAVTLIAEGAEQPSPSPNPNPNQGAHVARRLAQLVIGATLPHPYPEAFSLTPTPTWSRRARRALTHSPCSADQPSP